MILTNRLTANSFGLLQNFDRILDQALRGFEAPAHRQADGIYDYEDEDRYVLRLELPGFTKDEVSLSLENEELKVTAEAGKDSPAFQRSYEETFTYPEDIDPDTISAKLENGILELTLPKKEAEEPQSKNIEIQ